MVASFLQQTLETYDVPGTGFMLVNERDKVSALMEFKGEMRTNT